jgi:hypothetical protein
VGGAWFLHETIEVPSRRLLVTLWQHHRSRLVSRQNPAEGIEQAILDLQETEKRLLGGTPSATTGDLREAADSAVIQDDGDEKLRA